MARALVTGATGLIGFHLAQALNERGRPLRLMHRSVEPPALWAGWDVETVQADLTDATSLGAAVQGCDGVYHVAAHVDTSTRAGARMRRVNVDGTVSLVRAARSAGVRRLVNVSSIAAMGIAADGPTPETEPFGDGNRWLYNVSKRDAEDAAHEHAGSMDVISVRPSLVVGTGSFRRGSVARVIQTALKLGLPLAPSGGVNVVDVLDVVDTLIAAMDRGQPGERYLATGHNVRTRALMATICRLAGRPEPHLTLPASFTRGLGSLLNLWSRLGLPGQLPEQAVTMSGVCMYYNDDWTRARLRLSEAKPLEDTLRARLEWERQHS
ncbi:MAG: NAD-dependent epimerase/dehydratase family protein [Myxococcota bacterium]|nr:NAD-dependent epimerase/dehydratase family protein [Myxococcota bacterium]